MRHNLKKIIAVAVGIILVTVVSFFDGALFHLLLNIIISFTLLAITELAGLKWGFAFSILAPIATFCTGNFEILYFLPSLILGNALFALTIYLAPKVIEHSYEFFLFLTPVLGGSLLKYYVQFFTAVKFVPFLLKFSETDKLAAQYLFNSNQLIATLIGGMIGVVVVYIIKRFTAKKSKLNTLEG